jgi:(p)ppGpp synthase/HD superfamily hydrolase
MNNIIKAMFLCKKLHKDQKRKYSNKPYHTHPFRIASNVLTTYSDYFLNLEDSICAAFLHDTFEDCGATTADLFDHGFSLVTQHYVIGLTSYSKQIKSTASRKERKKMDLDYLEKQSNDIKLLKLLDRLDNVTELLKDLWNYEEAKQFAGIYYRETEDLLEVLKFDNDIWKELYYQNNQLID